MSRDIIYTVSDKFDSNPVLWLDATDLSTITKDGSNKVSEWRDKSGNGNHLIQGISAYQPTWTANSINGQAGIYFDGVDDFLNLINLYQIKPNFVLLTVFSKALSYTFTPLGKSDIWQYMMGYDSDEQFYIKLATTTFIFGLPTPLVDFNLYTSKNNNGAMSLFRNQIQIGTTQTSDVLYGTLDNLGKNANSFYNKGTLCELLVYEPSLPNMYVTHLENYLRQKYKI